MKAKGDGQHRLGIIALLGLVSGLPLLLTGSTLTVWLKVENVSLSVIGYFAWAHLPYTFKFVWAPLVDRFRLPFLGRRRGWMVLCQLLVALGIAAMAFVDPGSNTYAVFSLAIGVSFAAATLDIVVDAYRTEYLREDERGPGGALFVTGYRAAILIAGAGVLTFSEQIGWKAAYLCLSVIMLASIGITLNTRPSPADKTGPKDFRTAVVGPIVELFSRRGALIMVGFLLLFKLGENVAGHLIQPFLIDVNFTPTAVGLANKGLGLPASIAGTLLGGVAVTRLGLRNSLLVFGLLQAAPNLLYAFLADRGDDLVLLALVVSVDQFCNGLATAALVVLLMSLCDQRFTAFQYAALSSITTVLGRVLSGWSGKLQEMIGWGAFFYLTAAAVLPSMVFLLFMKDETGLPSNPPGSADESSNQLGDSAQK